MAHRFGSPEWAEALRRAIAESSEYRNAARGWGVGFDGSLLFVFDRDGATDRPPQRLLLHLAAGRCEGAEFLAPTSDSSAAFALRAPLALWRSILDRRILAATAILTGKLRVQGDMRTLLRHTGAARALIHCVASVETDWDAGAA